VSNENVATCRLNTEERKNLDQAIRTQGMANRSHFFRTIALQFSKQVLADENLEWPLRFALRKETKKAPSKSGRPAKAKSKEKS
jgi:hypothetical protein